MNVKERDLIAQLICELDAAGGYSQAISKQLCTSDKKFPSILAEWKRIYSIEEDERIVMLGKYSKDQIELEVGINYFQDNWEEYRKRGADPKEK